jgi:tellurite resistance protein
MEIFIGICVVLYIIGKISDSINKDSSTNYNNTTPFNPPEQPSRARINHQNTSDYMGEFQIRARHIMAGDDKDIPLIIIEARGSLTVNYKMDVEFVTFALDTTDDSDGEKIFCKADGFKNKNNHVYEYVKHIGALSPDNYYSDWSGIAFAPTEALVFPRSGNRIIKFYSFLTQKTSADRRQPLVSDDCQILHKYEDTGYKEWDEKRIDSMKATINLGVAVAFADGEFHKTEAAAIKDWLKKQVDNLDDDKQADATKKLNEEMIAAVNLAPHGKIDLFSAANALRNSPIKNSAYNGLELCTIIMAADGIINEEEIELLNRIKELLGIDNKELRGLVDKHAASAVTTSDSSKLSDELLIGLNTTLPIDEIRKEIRNSFSRYNGHLNIEKDSNKRKRYQDCIDACARLKKKYG